MRYIGQLLRFIYKVRLWLVLFPAIVAVYMIYKTRDMVGEYDTSSTIYTGIITGYNITSATENGNSTYFNQTSSLIQDLENIIVSDATLKRVSIRLFARSLINGNPYRDTKYITAANYREIYNRFIHPLDHSNLLPLIDKSSEDNTVNNLLMYEKNDKNNFIYGLLYYFHPLYSLNILKKIKVERIGDSDMLQISYLNSDPGIAYNTLDILNNEFVVEYDSLRFGQTDKVIDFYRQEVARTGSVLHLYEDTLTKYNVKNRVINYDEETKQIAATSGGYDLSNNTLMRNYVASKAALNEYESRMGNMANSIKKHALFLSKLQEVSNLEAIIAQKEIISNGNKNDAELKAFRLRLKQSEQDLRGYTRQISELQYGKGGVETKVLVDGWLEEMINSRKYFSQMKVMNDWKKDIDQQYVKFAPIGSEIKRKERNIDLVQQNYISAQSALNSAILQRRNLQMTSATLHVLNPPVYPLNPEPTQRRFIVMSATGVTFLFVFSFLLLWELLDTTLRDYEKAERLTKEKVFAAVPSGGGMSNRRYGHLCYEMAIRYLINSIFSCTDFKKPFVINMLSTRKKDGKSFISSWMADYMSQQGLNVKILNYHEDFHVNSRDFLLAETTSELGDFEDADVIIIEYPSLDSHTVPTRLLRDSNINLLITRSSRNWSSVDKINLSKLKGQIGKDNLKFVLNASQRYSVEYYTGQLPPYNFFRNFLYQLSNFALSSAGVRKRMEYKNKINERYK
jgi:hypothetical protein